MHETSILFRTNANLTISWRASVLGFHHGVDVVFQGHILGPVRVGVSGAEPDGGVPPRRHQVVSLAHLPEGGVGPLSSFDNDRGVFCISLEKLTLGNLTSVYPRDIAWAVW